MYSISLDVQFNASVERLYQAWHLPDLLQQWFAPAGMLVGQFMSSFTTGGKYRMVLQDPEGGTQVLMGEYLNIQTNELLSYTWHWQDEDEITQVDLIFRKINDTTSALTLVHKGFADKENCDLHQQAWIECLEKLTLITL